MAQLKGVDVEILDGGEGDGRGHGTVSQGFTMTQVQTLYI